MERVGGRAGEHDLHVARDLHGPARRAAVGDPHAPHLDVVFRRHDDFGVRFDAGIAAPELGAAFREDGLVALPARAGRLVRGGPRCARRRVAQIEEASPRIGRRVLVPARDRQVVPAAVAASAAGDDHVVAAVGQQLDLGRGGVDGADDADRRRGAHGRAARHGPLVERGLVGDDARHALLQQQQGGLDAAIGLEVPLHGPVLQQVRQGQQPHALMVRHERANHGALLPARQPGRGVVDRFVQAVAAGRARRGEPLQVRARLLGHDHQRHHRSVRRDHEVVGEAALQAESGDAERAVLVVHRRVGRVVARLRDAPRHAALPAVLDLALHGAAAGLVEQRVLVTGHQEQRHQVLEHRAAPRQQHRHAGSRREQAAEREPALLADLPARDRDEDAEPCFGGEQVVVAGVGAPLVDVVADRHQVARVVVQEPVFGVAHGLGPRGEAFDSLQPRARREPRRLDGRFGGVAAGCQLPQGGHAA